MKSVNTISLSIIIINYNTFDLTVNCIQSIYATTKNIKYEIILVDNASTEKNPDLFKEKFPNIILIKSKKNLGFSKGNNLGIEKSKGKVLLLLNSDVIVKDNTIESAYNYLLSDNKNGALTVKTLYPNGQLQSVCQRFPSIKYQLIELFRFHKLFSKRKQGQILLASFFQYNTIVEVDWIWGTFFMLKKDIILKMPEKKLNDDFFMYVEDMQWCMDIKKIGYKIKFIPNVEIVHYMGGSSAPKNTMMKNNYNIFLKNNYNLIHRIIIKLLRSLLLITCR